MLKTDDEVRIDRKIGSRHLIEAGKVVKVGNRFATVDLHQFHHHFSVKTGRCSEHINCYLTAEGVGKDWTI